MTTVIIFHEVQDGNVWAKAWKKGPGSRHEMFGELGIKCRTFRDPNNPNATGVMAEIPDMAKFQELLQTAEGQKAKREDGLKGETMRMLVEFTPQLENKSNFETKEANYNVKGSPIKKLVK